MMQEEDTTSAEAFVSEEKKVETQAEEEASSTALGSLAKDVGSVEPSISDRLDKTKEIMKDFGKTVAIEKPKQMFADIQGMASNFKEKVAFHNKESTNGQSGEPAAKMDPMEKPRQFFSGMKEKATSFKGFALDPGAATNAAPENPDLDVTSDESAPVVEDGPKNDALERSKEFFTGMKEKASSFKLKMPLPGEEKLDENGNPVPSPLDRMKADMKGLASGIRGKMATTNASRAASGSNANEGSAVFTISEDHEQEEGAQISAEQSKRPSNTSMNFNDFFQSARTQASGSLSSMPSLRSLNISDTSFSKLGDKFSAFRQSTIDPISKKLGMKHNESDGGAIEEINFGQEPTIVMELSPEYKIKESSSDEHWEKLKEGGSNDALPSMAQRNASMDFEGTFVPPPAPADSTSVTLSEN